jgi:hypothetical protein
MGGINIGKDFVSVKAARQGIIDFIRKTVGPRKNPRTGKPIKPDLIWAISVIKRTIPAGILTGEKRVEYERALDTFFDIRDELSQMETTIGLFWRDDDGE